MTINELKEKRAELVKKQQREYQRRGNTQMCQELFAEIMKIDEEIEKAERREKR